jgi:hypothetical protein
MKLAELKFGVPILLRLDIIPTYGLLKKVTCVIIVFALTHLYTL